MCKISDEKIKEISHKVLIFVGLLANKNLTAKQKYDFIEAIGIFDDV